MTFLIYPSTCQPARRRHFPELKLEVAPQQGSAIVFNDCFDNGEEDGRCPRGLPPANPGTVKYAINGWIRSEDRTSWGSMF